MGQGNRVERLLMWSKTADSSRAATRRFGMTPCWVVSGRLGLVAEIKEEVKGEGPRRKSKTKVQDESQRRESKSKVKDESQRRKSKTKVKDPTL